MSRNNRKVGIITVTRVFDEHVVSSTGLQDPHLIICPLSVLSSWKNVLSPHLWPPRMLTIYVYNRKLPAGCLPSASCGITGPSPNVTVSGMPSVTEKLSLISVSQRMTHMFPTTAGSRLDDGSIVSWTRATESRTRRLKCQARFRDWVPYTD